MKGLLLKDWKLLLHQKNFFLMLMVIAAFLSSSVSNASFLFMYLTVVGAMFTLSTISYDEFDNGNVFLFSLPITRRGYAGEKYLFGLLLGGGWYLFSFLLTSLSSFWKTGTLSLEILESAAGALPSLLLLLALMIPLQLKFGSEKSRVALLLAVGAAVVLAILGEKLAGSLGLDPAAALNRAAAMPLWIFLGLILGSSLLLLGISCGISVRILEKKEF